MTLTGPENTNLNAIILAGGDGTRLASLTRKITGRNTPKQFCPLIDGETLFDQTRRRLSLAVPPDQTLILLSEPQEQFYKPLLCDTAERNLVIQPRNRGTAVAILYALFRLIRQGRRENVAIFPCDHYVSDDQRFMVHVEAASSVVAEFPERLLLLGIPADKPETQYGWIEPAQPLDFDLMNIGPAFYIGRFWEKPSSDVAKNLWREGFFWNSFVMVGRIAAFLDLFARALPQLYISFAQLSLLFGTPRERETIVQLYDNIPFVSFSDKVLTEFSTECLVLPVRNVVWSDLGEPSRVISTIAQLGLHPKWLAA
jgi:mannose-1-phosphate guanylyltransferase